MTIKFEITHEDYNISLTKDSADANWYIRVLHPTGVYDYDGWWNDSEGRTVGEALDEAIAGAQIDTREPEPEGFDDSLIGDLFDDE